MFKMTKYLILLLLIPLTTLAQTFEPLVGIPGATDGGGDLSAYLNAIYRISISLAALLAVLVLIKAGVKYMFSDIVTDKASAKSDIRGAILGLLLIISAVLILSTINENITNFSISIAPIEVPPQEDRPILPGGGGEVSALCSGADRICEVRDCAFWRIELYCETWCRNQAENAEDTIYIHNGFTANSIVNGQMTHQCVVRLSDVEIARNTCLETPGNRWNSVTYSCVAADDNRQRISLRCVEDRSGGMENYTYDCTSARSDCANRGGEVLSLPTASRIECALPEPTIEYIGCDNRGTTDEGASLGFNCGAAQNTCSSTGGQVGQEVDGGSAITCIRLP
jgi:hypothetical protein